MDQETNTQKTEEPATVENSSSSAYSKKVKVWLKRAALHQKRADELGASGDMEAGSYRAGRASGYRVAAAELERILNS